MAIKKGTLDELLSGRDPKQVFSKDGLFDELKKALAERVLNAELDEHLDGEAGNGYSVKGPAEGSESVGAAALEIDDDDAICEARTLTEPPLRLSPTRLIHNSLLLPRRSMPTA